jgi:hypothetical protein
MLGGLVGDFGGGRPLDGEGRDVDDPTAATAKARDRGAGHLEGHLDACPHDLVLAFLRQDAERPLADIRARGDDDHVDRAELLGRAGEGAFGGGRVG